MSLGIQRDNQDLCVTQTCPVCACKRAKFIEQINLESQYKLYAPNNPIVQQRLLETGQLQFDNYSVLRCLRCQLEYAHPFSAPAAEWYEYAYNELDFHASDRWEFNFVASKLKPSERVGELGCGTGVFLQKCRDKHVDAHGLDFSSSSVEQCHAKGLSASLMKITGEQDLRNVLTDKKRSIIASFHALEHLENPHQLFSLASIWGTEDSVLWVAVPSDTRLDRLLHRKDILDDPPHHLTRWTPQAFSEIGKKNQWRLTSIVKEPLGLRQKLWSLYSSNPDYEQFLDRFKSYNKWSRRAVRYFSYPSVLIRHHETIKKLSGFSMLARFERSH